MLGDIEQNGVDLRDSGIQRAADHAEAKNPGWQTQAFDFIIEYAKKHQSFAVEDVRLAAVGKVPTPPSLRAWGHVVRKAAKAGAIRQIGIIQVKNPLAHRANAALWVSNIYERAA